MITSGDIVPRRDTDSELMVAVLSNWTHLHARTGRIICCPSYYSDDPILDVAFGDRPAFYLEQLGRLLDPAIQIMWTGEEVCAREYSPGHLALGRWKGAGTSERGCVLAEVEGDPLEAGSDPDDLA